MRTTNLSATLCGVTLLAVASAAAARAAEGDVALSGKLRYNAVLDVALAVAPGEDPATMRTTYEVTTLEYVFEAVAPATVGIPQPLDHAIVRELCGDKDGCEVTLQMVDWDPSGEPEAVASRTSLMFLAELAPEESVGPTSMPVEEGKYFRFDQQLDISGVDDDFFLTNTVWKFYDCIFTDAESGSGDNTVFDLEPGFALLNCENVGPLGCTYSDADTVCRLVMRD